MPIVLSSVLAAMAFVFPKLYKRLTHFQIALATTLFSIYFELLLPQYSANYVRDPFDVLCYFVGAIAFALFFNPKQKNKNHSALA